MQKFPGWSSLIKHSQGDALNVSLDRQQIRSTIILTCITDKLVTEDESLSMSRCTQAFGWSYLQHVHLQKSCHLIHILAACTPVYSGWWHRSPSFMCYAFQSSSFSHTGSVITHLFLLLQDPAAVLNEVGLLAGLKTLSAWWGTKLRLSLTTLSPLWRETGNNNIYMVGISVAWKSIHS